MNTDYLENVRSRLLAMIDEAEKLPAEQIEGIPGTSILVKRGSANDFASLAHSYFELKNNQFADGNYLEEVYQELMDIRNKKINDDLEREEERQMSVAYDLYAENHNSITKLGYLNTSLKINLDDQKKYKNALDNKVFDEKEWAERTNLLRTLESLSKSELAIRKDIAVIKDQVNSKVKEVIEEEIQRIRDNYRHDRQGLEIAYGMKDGVSILAKDKTLYDDLCYLLNALNKVNEKYDIICVDNILCVNPNQEAAVKEWIKSINIFKLMNKPQKKKQEEKEIKKDNADLIKEISKELDRLREQGSEEATKEYNKLTEILTYLNKANYASYVTPVWGAYVENKDKYIFENLIKDCAFFQKYNPDAKMLEENKKLVRELKQQLLELQNNVKNYKGDTNPDLVLVGDTPILESDVPEYHRILAMISMLENSKENLIPVAGGGNVSLEYLDKYKELVGIKKEDVVKRKVAEVETTEPASLKPQKIEINTEVKKSIAKELEAILKKALDNPNEPMVVNGNLKVLKSDLTRYNLLVSEYEILSEIYDNDSLIEIEGVRIPDYKEEEYKKIKEQLKDLDKESKVVDYKGNDELISFLEEIKNKYNYKAKFNILVKLEGLVDNAINILRDAKNTRDLEEVTNVNFGSFKTEINKSLQLPKVKVGEFNHILNSINEVEEKIDVLKDNLELMSKIDERIKIIFNKDSARVTEKEKWEYNLLKQKLEILNNAFDLNFGALVDVGKVKVDYQMAETYKEIEADLEKLAKSDLDFKSNDELIQNLRKKMQTLDVQDEAYKLYLEAINILESAKSSSNVKEIAELNYNGQMIDIYIPVKVPVDKIDDLANCIGSILDLEDELKTNLNEDKIAEIKKQIDELKTVDENNNPVILPHNEEEYDLLSSQYNILNKVINTKDTVNIGGAIVIREDEKQYRYNLDALKKISERKYNIVKANKDRVDKITKEIDEMYALDSNIDTEYRKEKYNLLVKQLSVLKNFNLKEEYEEIDGVYVNKSDVNRFKASVDGLNNLSPTANPHQEEDKPQKHRFNSRKTEEKGFLRRNAKKIAGIGIGLYLVPKVLPLLAMAGVTSIGMVGVGGAIAAFYVLYKKFKDKNNIDTISDETVRDAINDIVNEVPKSTRNDDLSNASELDEVVQSSKPQIEIPDEDDLFEDLEEALDNNSSLKM